MLARFIRFIAIAAMTCLSGAALAQYPSHPVTIVVPYGAGGPTDAVARVLAEGLSKAWGQPVVVENRAGAGGNIGSDRVARALPDGHTLLVIPSGVMVLNPLLFKQMPFAPLTDLAPISQLGSGPILMFVSTKVPVNSVAEFVEYARKNPGKLNFTSPGVGTIPHLAGEMLMQQTGIKMVHVPYQSAPQATQAVVAGDAEVIFDATTALTYSAAGRLKPLMVLGDTRFAPAGDVPTAAEAGLPRMTVDAWYAIVAPAKTPPAVLQKVQADAATIVRSQATRDRLSGIGFIPLANRPEEFERSVKAEAGMWKKVFDAAGITPQ
ncbi:Tripartite tricarboxylate transporter family receptor [Pigmentiphaga humi]|uniref:Tripartite tricarboxylate transporter family receptor n=1 Tax=Pigmentiphaga humi TaxID=2478468 RepID=A0A3P4AW21_9BURK|nr:tripartite tricarboxylate transporter substrate binding protein [Pigmentiphaga humi]VCU68259.1 Tripartite tricarboxylate transporter family receptor [Pigmentiphaga humi]